MGKAKSLSPCVPGWTVSVTFETDKPDGMLVTHGGASQGYCLYLQGGKPAWTVRSSKRVATVIGSQPVGTGWNTLTAMITADKHLVLLCNGEQVAKGKLRDFISKDPNLGLRIGANHGSQVVSDNPPPGFTGAHRIRANLQLRTAVPQVPQLHSDSDDTIVCYAWIVEVTLMNLLVRLVFISVALMFVLRNRPAEAEPHQNRCVIMVTIDGLANFYIDDPKIRHTGHAETGGSGARAEGGMIAAFPTVTWPTHTTLATGTTPARHGVVGNNYFDRATGKIVPLILDRNLNKAQTVQTPTIYDAAHQASLKTAAVCWPASREAESLDWTVPDMFEADAEIWDSNVAG